MKKWIIDYFRYEFNSDVTFVESDLDVKGYYELSDNIDYFGILHAGDNYIEYILDDDREAEMSIADYMKEHKNDPNKIVVYKRDYVNKLLSNWNITHSMKEWQRCYTIDKVTDMIYYIEGEIPEVVDNNGQKVIEGTSIIVDYNEEEIEINGEVMNELQYFINKMSEYELLDITKDTIIEMVKSEVIPITVAIELSKDNIGDEYERKELC